MRKKEYNIINFDFASLYPTIMRDFGTTNKGEIIRKIRKQKIEKIIENLKS